MSIEKYLERITLMVSENGWAIQLVHAGENTPAYGYTVGLLDLADHPEIALVGLHPDTTQKILRKVADDVAKGHRFDRTCRVDQILREYHVVFIEVEHASAQEHLPVARSVRGGDVKAMQLIVPDGRGWFPWDVECDERYVEIQTGLLDVGPRPEPMKLD